MDRLKLKSYNIDIKKSPIGGGAYEIIHMRGDFIMEELSYFLRNAYGESEKSKYNETGSCSDMGLIKKIHKKWDYYDQCKKTVIKDSDGNVVGITYW